MTGPALVDPVTVRSRVGHLGNEPMIVVHHNPDSGTSRKVLSLIAAAV